VFPEFSLSRLLRTVFAPKAGERIDVLIDLPDPKQIEVVIEHYRPAPYLQRALAS